MSDKPETIASVLAEMLLDADVLVFPTLTPDKLRTYASRIAAAAERERNAHTNDIHDALYKATGIPVNADAMRVLLEKIRHEYGWGRIGCRTCVSSEADVERVSDLFEKQIDAALAAPARNCDRLATAEEAFKAWESDNKKPPEQCFLQWLFAPAEGGDHA